MSGELESSGKKHLLCLLLSRCWKHDIDLMQKVRGGQQCALARKPTGAFADSFLGGREAPFRTGADEITPVACQRVK